MIRPCFSLSLSLVFFSLKKSVVKGNNWLRGEKKGKKVLHLHSLPWSYKRHTPWSRSAAEQAGGMERVIGRWLSLVSPGSRFLIMMWLFLGTCRNVSQSCVLGQEVGIYLSVTTHHWLRTVVRSFTPLLPGCICGLQVPAAGEGPGGWKNMLWVQLKEHCQP